MYWDETEVRYHLILSKGKGKLTPFLENKLLEMVNETYWGFSKDRMNSGDIINDCYLRILENWMKIDLIKYHKTLPFFTQMVKNQIYYSTRTLNGYALKDKIDEIQLIPIYSIFLND